MTSNVLPFCKGKSIALNVYSSKKTGNVLEVAIFEHHDRFELMRRFEHSKLFTPMSTYFKEEDVESAYLAVTDEFQSLRLEDFALLSSWAEPKSA